VDYGGDGRKYSGEGGTPRGIAILTIILPGTNMTRMAERHNSLDRVQRRNTEWESIGALRPNWSVALGNP
jgi:hypothetical protein